MSKGPSQEAPQLSQEVVDFLHSGVTAELATRDERNRPTLGTAYGVKVDRATRTMRLIVPAVFAKRLLPNVESNGQIAAVFCRPTDNRSVQVKGQFLRDADRSDDPELRLRYRMLLGQNFALTGVPRSLGGRMGDGAGIAITFRIEQVFDQTPGPNAGKVMAG